MGPTDIPRKGSVTVFFNGKKVELHLVSRLLPLKCSMDLFSHHGFHHTEVVMVLILENEKTEVSQRQSRACLVRKAAGSIKNTWILAL